MRTQPLDSTSLTTRKAAAKQVMRQDLKEQLAASEPTVCVVRETANGALRSGNVPKCPIYPGGVWHGAALLVL